MTIVSNIDFHCHTTASDGAFSPEQIVMRAYERGLNYLAITDHDQISGIEEAINTAQRMNALLVSNDANAPQENYIRQTAQVDGVENGVLEREAKDRQLTIIPGSELSITWREEQIHIVGLFLDIQNARLQEHIEFQKECRLQRAKDIAHKLELLGIKDSYERCCEKAAAGASITRGNYARLIYEDGLASSIDDAFNKYLARGKPAYVRTTWGTLENTVEVIKQASGVAIIAHPRRYKFTNRRLRALIEDFKRCGGLAIEVSSCQQSEKDRHYLTELCGRYDLMASLGSDFHTNGLFRELGQNLDLPAHLTPVWHHEAASRFNMSDAVKQRLVKLSLKKE